MTRDIVEQLRAELSPEERRAIAGPRGGVPVAAWQDLLRGRLGLAAWDSTSALDSFRHAIERAPDYAEAWAGLAQAFAHRLVFLETPPREAHALGREAARRALALDESVAGAHMALATLAFNHEWASSPPIACRRARSSSILARRR